MARQRAVVEAMALRRQRSLASYDRLFPSQDMLPLGEVGNLIAALLQGKARREGTMSVRRSVESGIARGQPAPAPSRPN